MARQREISLSGELNKVNACLVHLQLRNLFFVAVLVKMHHLSYVTLYMTNFFLKRSGEKKAPDLYP